MEKARDDSFLDMKKMVSEFIDERDWERYHRPKDIAMALSIESGELMELFLWDREPDIGEIRDEVADVLFFLVDLSMRYDIDLVSALEDKIEKNKLKYPADVVRGKDHKYTRYKEE
jgi:NTP pyrophosphatase (non-canonical NTP hydrolase)